MKQKTGYLEWNVVTPTTFAVSDDKNNLLKEYTFEAQDPQTCIRMIADVIQENKVDHVVCNEIGYGICDSISRYLKTQYDNTTCYFTQMH